MFIPSQEVTSQLPVTKILQKPAWIIRFVPELVRIEVGGDTHGQHISKLVAVHPRGPEQDKALTCVALKGQ